MHVNLGIGTTEPNEKLEVNGNIRIGDGSGESLKFGAQRILYRDGTALYIGEIDSSAIPLQFRSGGNDVMHITTTGNVGIGTTNPGSYKLYVNGNGYVNGTFAIYNQDELLTNY